jgi:hypothetical protein
MNHDWRQLEARVEREMRLLAALPETPPSPQRLRAVKDAVLRAARRRRLWPRRLAAMLAPAAALLVAFLTLPMSTDPVDPFADQADSLEAWTMAIGVSGRLLDDAVVLGLEDPLPEGDAFDAFFNNLDRSLAAVELGI